MQFQIVGINQPEKPITRVSELKVEEKYLAVEIHSGSGNEFTLIKIGSPKGVRKGWIFIKYKYTSKTWINLRDHGVDLD